MSVLSSMSLSISFCVVVFFFELGKKLSVCFCVYEPVFFLIYIRSTFIFVNLVIRDELYSLKERVHVSLRLYKKDVFFVFH